MFLLRALRRKRNKLTRCSQVINASRSPFAFRREYIGGVKSWQAKNESFRAISYKIREGNKMRGGKNHAPRDGVFNYRPRLLAAGGIFIL